MSSENVYSVTPEISLFTVMGQIFDKLTPMLEAAEEHALPPGIAACSMNQVALGAFLLEIYPRPDLIIGTSFFCDQTPKMEEVISETYGIPIVYIDAPGDEAWGEYPETHPRKISYFGRELRQAINEVEKMGIFKMNATEEILHEVRVEVAKLWFVEGQILQLMKADPQPMSWVDLQVVSWQVFMPGPNTRKYMPDILALLRDEIKERVAAGKGVMEKGGPTVLCFACSVADPGMTHLFEELGLHTPSQLFYWISPYEMKKAQYTTFEEKVAESHLRYAIHGGAYAVNLKMEAMIKEFKADGVLLYYPLGCRPTACWPYIMKKYIEEELKIPALVLEGDWGDKRSYTVETSRTRVETFAQMLKAAKETKANKAM